MRKTFIILSIAILLLSAIPRSVEILGGNYLFGFDQGLFYQDVKKIVVDHKLTLIGSFSGGQGGLFQGPGWYYLLSIPFFLWNGDPYGGMVLMLLIGLLTVALSIYFISKMFGEKTALITGLLVAISPALVSQSRFIWPPFPVSLLTVIYLYFIFRVFQRNEIYLPMATLVIGLMSHFELATSGTFFIQFLLFSPILLFRKFVSLKFLVLSFLSFSLTFLPLIIFNFRHENIMLRGILNIIKGGSSEHQVTLKYVEQIFLNHFEVFKFNFLSFFPQGQHVWFIVLGILLFGGILYIRDKKIKQHQKLFMVYLLSSPLTLFVVFMLYLWPIWQWWILQLLVFYIFAFGAISAFLWQKKLIRPLILVLFLFFLGSFFRDSINFYKNDLNDYGGTAKIRGKIDAIDYLYKDARNEKFGLLVFTPPVYTFAYDYLLWWHGGKKYNYIPYNEKKGNFYLLIEPDPHKEWSYKGWLETVIKTGTIMKTVELPSGFIVQKRVL